jgi:hypothetical protein
VITSKQILKAAGLKSAKTLTRWAGAGFIPKPHIGTHPKGRGKIAYWPDWVLDRCRRIAALQREGHTLASAVFAIEHDRMVKLMEHVETSPSVDTILSGQKIKLHDGRELDLASLLHIAIVKEAANVVLDPAAQQKLALQMRAAGVAAEGLRFMRAGYNPICLFDGEKTKVMPDFLVAHMLSEAKPSPSAWMIIPLLPPLRKTFSSLGRELPKVPTARPAPKVWFTQGDAIVEYDVFLGGILGFELINDGARTIGKRPGESETNDG